MAEYVQLNPGSGGAKIATFRDGDGNDWPAGVFGYAVTLSEGANVLQIVTPDHGLPVELVGDGVLEIVQTDEDALKATVHQGGSWVVGLAEGATVAVTQSGTWNIAQPTASNLNATVVQSDPANLKVTATLASGSTVALASGTAVEVSGTVATTQSGTWTVDIEAGAEVKLASGSSVGVDGVVRAAVDGSAVYDGETALTPVFKAISASSSGDTAIVAGVTGKKIRVLRWGLTANGADVSVKWRSASTDLTGVRSLTKFASAGGAYCPVGIFETAAGEELNLNLSTTSSVGGELTYVLV